MLVELDTPRRVADDDSAKPPVPNENIRAKAEQEIRDVHFARGSHGVRKLVGAVRLEVEIGWPANAKGRIRSEGDVALEASACQRRWRVWLDGYANTTRDAFSQNVETFAESLMVFGCDGRARHDEVKK
jgi:hypothetical protein